MRAKFDPIYSVEVPPPQKTLHPAGTKFQIWTIVETHTVLYSRGKICVIVTLSTQFLAPNEGTEKSRAKGTTVLCVRGYVFLGVCCLFQIGYELYSVSMLPLVKACRRKRGAPTVFKSVLPVLDATLDHPGTAMQTRPRPGPKRARCRLRVERCVCVVLCNFECAACIRLGLRCPVSAWHLW